MPFTFSHPAIVLPFSRIKHGSVSMSGLIIGSIVPDFEYIIKMKATGRYGHSLEGIFILDLPLAFLMVLVFHYIIKRPLIDNSPKYFRERLVALRNFEFSGYLQNHYLSFFLCLFAGVISHIAWDSFTHPNEYFTKDISFLTSRISLGSVREFPVYTYLQYISSIVGALYIMVFFHRLPVHQVSRTLSIKFWLITVLLGSVVFVVRASFSFEYFADIVATTISSGLVGVIASSIYFYLSSKPKNESA